MNKQIKTIIFDIYGTLTQDLSWHYITQALGARKEQEAELFALFREGKISYPDAKRQLIALWLATGNANKDFIRNAFINLALRPDALKVISQLQKNYQICLISGSMDLYIETVAEKLAITDWYANTKLIFNADGKLTDMDYTLDQASKKWEQFQTYMSENKYKINECAIVGNGEGDKILFEKLGLAVLVDSDEKTVELEKLADANIKTLPELLEIFKQ